MKTTSPTNEAAKTKDESKSSLQAVRDAKAKLAQQEKTATRPGSAHGSTPDDATETSKPNKKDKKEKKEKKEKKASPQEAEPTQDAHKISKVSAPAIAEAPSPSTTRRRRRQRTTIALDLLLDPHRRTPPRKPSSPRRRTRRRRKRRRHHHRRLSHHKISKVSAPAIAEAPKSEHISKCYKFQRIEPTSCGSLATSLGGWWCSKEAAVLAKWLKGVTLAIAEANPNDEHAALFSLKISRVVKLKQNNFVLSWWVNIWMWEIHLGCELHFLWIWWLCDHVYQRTAILVLCWLRRTVQSSFVQIFFSTVLTIALCLYQGATKAVKKWLNFGWTDFFVCCKVCWGLSREALEMELLLYKVRPKYHQLLGSEETSI